MIHFYLFFIVIYSVISLSRFSSHQNERRKCVDRESDQDWMQIAIDQNVLNSRISRKKSPLNITRAMIVQNWKKSVF